ncbi:hypothetical protein LWI29_031125 [Acer saccharum]|uniref:Reverse transcriptase Ty1/copia-type domain-containing protein n=1 Tax=Acer saccharum TaxID=4024 RepID=A0AA39RTP1_ACESA|nr:hypothetical protein LWI29_031125 [Acer saccharum]
MVQPPDFINSTKLQHVCNLRKAIYGLRQALRAWYTELRTFLLVTGFNHSKCDASLFIRQRPRHTLYLIVYVDDIIVTGSSDSQVHDFIATLAHWFSLKDLGQLSFFLGVEAHRSPRGLYLSQQQYICDLLVKTNMLDAKPPAELNWIGHLLHELRIQVSAPLVIYCDNVGATYVCTNPIFHSRMKHVAIDFFFARDQVARHQLRVAHVKMKDQLADSLTKALARKHFQDHRSKIGVLAESSILRGHISCRDSQGNN